MVFAPKQLGRNQFVDVEVDGLSVTRLALTKTQAERFEVMLPKIGPDQDGYRVQFWFSDRRSPAELGIGKNFRKLGFGIFSIQIDKSS
jgi:hypothetical protein